MKLDGVYGRWQDILYKQHGATTRAYELSADSNFGLGEPLLALNNGSTLLATRSPTVLPTGQWVHFAGTWSGTTARVYVDGVLKGSITISGPLVASTGMLRIGGLVSSGNRYFDGSMDEVRIYDRALSQSEIQDDMAISVFDQTTDPPLNEELPTVSGLTVDGEPLSAAAGMWSGTGPLDYAYQWRRCDEEGENCTDISGATDATLDLEPDDVDHTVRVAVTAEGPGGEEEAVSAPTALVSGFTATITGTARRSEALRAEAGTWRGPGSVSYDYQWQRCDENGEDCDDIDGARRLTYSLKAEDIGHTIRVKIAAGPETTLTRSAATAVVVERLASRAVDPPIYGHAAVGETIGTASDGWNPGSAAVTYQWRRCDEGGEDCTPIAGADRRRARDYALRWAEGRNPAYGKYDNDCTNFVSQVWRSGGQKPMREYDRGEWSWWSKYGWVDDVLYTYDTESWRLVEKFFEQQVQESKRAKNMGRLTPRRWRLGDVLVFNWHDGGPDKDHLSVVTASGVRPRVTHHSRDRKNVLWGTMRRIIAEAQDGQPWSYFIIRPNYKAANIPPSAR